MPEYLENLNMDFFQQSAETYKSLINLVASEGKAIIGYYDLPHLNRLFGSVQIVVRTRGREQIDGVNGRCITDAGIDTHTSGYCVWEARMEINVTRKDADLLSKRTVVRSMDGCGIAVVNLVNADVLPSFMKDDIVKMQMVAFPELIEYYKDEDDYASHQPDSKDGQKHLIREGEIIPTGLLRILKKEESWSKADDSLFDLTAVRGIVKRLYWGKFEFEGETHNTYLRCIIDTDFGELEIAHTIEQVKEELRCNMEVGSTVLMYGTLSGDVAIYEYDKGIVRNEENNLAAMRYMFSHGNPERIRSILADDVVYIARDRYRYEGVDAVIDRLKYVQSKNPDKYVAHFGKITAVDDGEEELEYSVGKQCLILAKENESNYESIAFFDYNEKGNISRMVTSNNPRYHFAIRESVFDFKKEE